MSVGLVAALAPIAVVGLAAATGAGRTGMIVAGLGAAMVAGALIVALLARILRGCADQLAEFEYQRGRWREEARTDPLCGVLNRRGAYEQAATVAARAEPGAAWTVMALDIDRFKLVNDEHGHAVGDRVLVMVGDVLARNLPTGATVARWGGDEFVVFALADRPLPAGWAERIAESVSEHLVPCRAGNVRVTISFGIAEGAATCTLDDVLAAADDRLLVAKAAAHRTITLQPGGWSAPAGWPSAGRRVGSDGRSSDVRPPLAPARAGPLTSA